MIRSPSKPLCICIIILVQISFSLVYAQPGACAEGSGRPAQWASPVQKKGLPNLFKVSDVLYRGAQPTTEGFSELKKMGIRTIVNLRQYHSDESLIRDGEFKYFQIPMMRTRPDKQSYQKFLNIVRNPDLQPVFVHCRHGADRTGTAIALYRITIEQWDKEAAVRELKEGGYGYHAIFRALIKFIREYESLP